MRKGKDPEPYLQLIDPDPGGPKTCGSCGSGSPTLVVVIKIFLETNILEKRFRFSQDSARSYTLFFILLRDIYRRDYPQIFKINFFYLLLFEATFTSFFKNKKSKRAIK
jgi:hypothetical protein